MKSSRFALVAALGLLGACGCHTLPHATPPTTAAALTNTFFPDKLAAMDAAIEQAIVDGRCPGGVLWLERTGVTYVKAFGQRAVVPVPEPMSVDTIFDFASLTKVVATTPAMMLLIERGKVDLEAPAQRYLPEFTGHGKETITIRQLLTHTSGLRPGIGSGGWQGQDGAIRMAAAERLQSPPGTALVYSDINFFLLGAIVQRVSGRGLDEFLAAEVYGPLKMTDTGFRPAAVAPGRIAPTTVLVLCQSSNEG
jgi:CubicO group peptidase (beta-lactamase class C family)